MKLAACRRPTVGVISSRHLLAPRQLATLRLVPLAEAFDLSHPPPINPRREGLQRQRVPEPCAMVIFGASGYLAHRKLVPAIYGLAHEGSLPPYFALVAVAVSEFTTESFRKDMRQAVE